MPWVRKHTVSCRSLIQYCLKLIMRSFELPARILSVEINWEIKHMVRKFPTFHFERKKMSASEANLQFVN